MIVIGYIKTVFENCPGDRIELKKKPLRYLLGVQSLEMRVVKTVLKARKSKHRIFEGFLRFILATIYEERNECLQQSKFETMNKVTPFQQWYIIKAQV